MEIPRAADLVVLSLGLSRNDIIHDHAAQTLTHAPRIITWVSRFCLFVETVVKINIESKIKNMKDEMKDKSVTGQKQLCIESVTGQKQLCIE